MLLLFALLLLICPSICTSSTDMSVSEMIACFTQLKDSSLADKLGHLNKPFEISYGNGICKALEFNLIIRDLLLSDHSSIQKAHEQCRKLYPLKFDILLKSMMKHVYIRPMKEKREPELEPINKLLSEIFIVSKNDSQISKITFKSVSTFLLSGADNTMQANDLVRFENVVACLFMERSILIQKVNEYMESEYCSIFTTCSSEACEQKTGELRKTVELCFGRDICNQLFGISDEEGRETNSESHSPVAASTSSASSQTTSLESSSSTSTQASTLGTFLDSKMDVIWHFVPEDLVIHILSFMDWKELLYKVRFLCKRIWTVMDKEFILSKNLGLKQLFLQQSTEKAPFKMFAYYPWNVLFSNPHAMIKYYHDNFNLDGNQTWLAYAYRGISLYQFDDELLLSSLKAAPALAACFLEDCLDTDNCVKIVNIATSENVFVPVFKHARNYVHFLKRIKQPEVYVKSLLASHYDCTSLTDYLQFVEDPGIPTIVYDVVSEIVKSNCPMTSVSVRRLSEDRLRAVWKEATHPKVLLAIFIAFTDHEYPDILSTCTATLTSLIVHVLAHPDLMTTSQFASLLGLFDHPYCLNILRKNAKGMIEFLQQVSL